MAVTLSVSAVAAAGAVWLVLLIARPSTSSAPAQPPAPEQDPPAATQREATPARSRVAPASRVVRPTDSPSATGSLRVESQPTGARVSFDGEPIGDTPIVLTEVTPGEHQIGLDLESRGYKRWSSPVVVSAGREEKLLAVMTPVSARR